MIKELLNNMSTFEYLFSIEVLIYFLTCVINRFIVQSTEAVLYTDSTSAEG